MLEALVALCRHLPGYLRTRLRGDGSNMSAVRVRSRPHGCQAPWDRPRSGTTVPVEGRLLDGSGEVGHTAARVARIRLNQVLTDADTLLSWHTKRSWASWL